MFVKAAEAARLAARAVVRATQPERGRGNRTPPARLRPELELLFRCARTRLDDGTAAHVRALAGADLDWDDVVMAAATHGVLPLLHRALRLVAPDRVPEAVLDAIRERAVETATGNLYLVTVLVDVLDVLARHGIPALPIKGPTLAAAVYGNVALREFADLDILIREADLASAARLLSEHGFRRSPPVSGLGAVAYRQSECAIDFVSDWADASVEVHWDLMPRYFSLRTDPEEAWDDAEEVDLQGTTVRTLSVTRLLVFLCLHGAKHRWEQLRWICDVAELVRARPDLDWERAVRHAEQLGGVRMLMLGTVLAADLLGAPVDAAAYRRAGAHPGVPALVAAVRGRLLGGRRGSFARDNRFLLRAMDSTGQRLRYCANLALIPTKHELGAVALPAWLSFLYYPLHTVRLLGAAVRMFQPGAVGPGGIVTTRRVSPAMRSKTGR